VALRPVVVGFGPCGIFAALVLAQMGFKPIVLERGKNVRERTQDTWGLWRKRSSTPKAMCSLAKAAPAPSATASLYSQIKDPRHLGRKVMEEFVRGGPPPKKSCMWRIRISAPSSWSRWWRACARRSSRWAGRSVSNSA
jgi:uncharacterized FAD-dependent dehydrogenase